MRRELLRPLQWGLALLVLLLIAGLMIGRQPPAPSIKIGVLHSLSGTMAVSERPLVDGLQLAIEEANAAGGINGQQIEAVVVDCRSDWPYCAQQAERLITEEKVSALFGCWTSACRKAVKPVVEKHRHLLFYPVQYEGMESSPNLIYTGATPNQQIIPGVNWALQKLGKRAYLVGSDYVFPRMANILVKDLINAQGAVVSGERYLPLGASDVAALVADIVKQRPQVILNTLNGDSNAAFFSALEKAGLADLPIVSFSVAETEMQAWGGNRLTQHYAVWSYFQSLRHLEQEGPEVLLVSACDKLHNARAIVSDQHAIGTAVFERFSASRDQVIWYYRTLADIYRDKMPGLM